MSNNIIVNEDDNIKKVMVCCLIVIAMISSLAFVSAGFNYHEIRVTNGTVSMEGNTFNIPEGYVLDNNLELINEQYESTKDVSFSQAVFNETNSSNYFRIFVSYVTNGGELTQVPHPENCTNATINGINGYFFEENNVTYFIYLKNGNSIEINSNQGEELFEKIL